MDFKTLATNESADKTANALREHHFEPVRVNSKEEALAKILELIPDGASVMNGASETLREIGFTDLLKRKHHKWNNLHDLVFAETDANRQAKLRKHTVLSDFYLGSAHAITENGELLFASNTGSQLPHLAFTSQNIILVVSTAKIVPNLSEGMRRIKEYIMPLEDVRMKGVYGYGTAHNKTLILHDENPALGRRVHIILVNENLGF